MAFVRLDVNNERREPGSVILTNLDKEKCNGPFDRTTKNARRPGNLPREPCCVELRKSRSGGLHIVHWDLLGPAAKRLCRRDVFEAAWNWGTLHMCGQLLLQTDL